MQVAELFAGIGGFRIAADSLGLETIWANDIDPVACDVYGVNFGKGSILQGDIRQIWHSIPKHQILTAGFPCQPFSSAGKKQGIRDPRGTLFEVIVEVLRFHRPTYFVLENVKRLLTMERGIHFATILSALTDLNYRVEWRLLNAKRHGLAQNRERIFIIGFDKTITSGPSLALLPDEDQDALPDGVVDAIAQFDMWKSLESHGTSFSTWGLADEGSYICHDVDDFTDAQPPVYLKEVLEKDVAPEFDFTSSTVDRLVKNTEVNRFVQGVEILSNQGGGARMGYTVFGVNGLAPTLTASTSRHYERYKIGSRYRRLTAIEYARLQGFSDKHCAFARQYDQYSLLGNAVPPPMAEWVLRQTISSVTREKKPRSKRRGQMGLFAYAR